MRCDSMVSLPVSWSLATTTPAGWLVTGSTTSAPAWTSSLPLASGWCAMLALPFATPAASASLAACVSLVDRPDASAAATRTGWPPESS